MTKLESAVELLTTIHEKLEEVFRHSKDIIIFIDDKEDGKEITRECVSDIQNLIDEMQKEIDFEKEELESGEKLDEILYKRKYGETLQEAYSK